MNKERNRKSDILLIIFAVIVLIILIIAIIFLTKKQKEDLAKEIYTIDTQTTERTETSLNQKSSVCINEVSSDGWVEIYNASDDDVNISGYECALGNESVTFEEDTVIKSHELYSVFLGTISSADSRAVYLSDEQGNWVDGFYVPKTKLNESYARKTDGDLFFAFMSSSIDSSNYDEDLIEKTVPYFMLPDGFYQAETTLKIYVPENTVVYYSIDGSEPTKESLSYDDEVGIELENASKKNNEYSGRTDLSAYSSYTPSDKVDKCNIVRAVAIDKYGVTSKEIIGIYYVDVSLQSILSTMKVYTITVEPNDLFDYFDGIYVTGRGFDDALAKETSYGIASNYCKGKCIPSSVTVFENGVKADEFDCDFSVFFDSSINQIQKSLLMQDNEGNEILLSTGSEDTAFKLRNLLLNEFAAELGIPSQQVSPCLVFLEGEFWGFYLETEMININTIASRVGCGTSNLEMLPADGYFSAETNVEDWNELYEFIIGNDLSIDENYEAVCQKIDIQNYIDVYCYNIYIANSNFPENSLYIYRDKESGDQRWKFITGNLNTTMELDNVNSFTVDTFLHPEISSDLVLNSLMRNEGFVNSFRNKMIQISGKFESDEYINLVETDFAEYSKAILKSYERFFGGISNETLNLMKDELLNYAENRQNYLKLYLEEFIETGRELVSEEDRENIVDELKK